MIEFFKLVLSVIPFVLICLFGKKVNLKKIHRSRQVLMPIIALILCIIGFCCLDRINQGILDFIYNIPVWLDKISPDIADSAENIIDSINLSYWLFFITNPLMLIAYYIVKRIIISVLSGIFSKDRALHRKLAGLFYSFEMDKNIWVVKPEFGQLRQYFSDFYYGAVIISSMLFIASREWMSQGKLTSPYYPVFGIIIVGELYFFLDGLTRSEYFRDILGEDEEAEKTVNYSLMRKFLRTVFARHLAAEDTLFGNSADNSFSAGDLIEELLMSDDPVTENCGKYYKSISDSGFNLDTDYIKSSLDMLHGESVLFNNPFYQDLIPYIFYPMNRTLMCHKKVLIILGRHSIEKEITEWIHNGILSVTKLPELWQVGMLSDDADPDIGIISRSDVHDCELHAKKREFFSNVEFVVIIEPSKLTSTAQIGLTSIIKYIRSGRDGNVVFCSCDKNCDGLVDALSHMLAVNISEVSATGRNTGTVSYMCWDYDDSCWQHNLISGVSHYLGIGTELSLAALKNQIQTAWWYGGEAYPVADQLWIDGQYYFDMAKYAGLPAKQETIQQRFKFVSGMWNASVTENAYMTVEDEADNMFEAVREFSTRVTGQGFINVISSDYMLKDYMADNAGIFMADPKAIPYITADYARTRQNTAMRTMLMFSSGSISEDELVKEFSLLGIRVKNLKSELWQLIIETYASLDLTSGKLPEKELDIYDRDLDEHFVFDDSVIEITKRFSIEKNSYEQLYSISDRRLLRIAASQLRSAAYIAEDEKGNRHFLGTELYGHVFQRHLPGQLFTFDGKYYEMCSVSADMSVLLRRASDHITGRPSYRQIRKYTIERTAPIEDIGEKKKISGITVSNELADIIIETPAYLQSESVSDFFNAKRVEISGIPARSYQRKRVLRLEFEGIDDFVRYTLTFLLNEVFGTVFGDNKAYIAAVTEIPDFGDDSEENENDAYKRPLCCSLNDMSENSGNGSIYIVEDSKPDLGLTVAFERNMLRIFGIIADYLDWHMEKIRTASDSEPESEPDEETPVSETEPDLPKKKGFFGKIREKLGSLFGRKNKNASVLPEKNDDNDDDDHDITVSAEEEKSKKTKQHEREPYSSRNFLLLGGSGDNPTLQIGETAKFLNSLGLGNNPLGQARHGRNMAAIIESGYDPHKANAHFCDFCGIELVGTEFETLIDGRERCMNCGRTAIKTAEDFTSIFKDVMRNMESLFGIQFNCGISVEMVNTEKLQRVLHEKFVPTSGFDARAIGLAVGDPNGYRLLIENGSPRTSAAMTIAHELTHIWQFLNWDRKYIIKKYGRSRCNEIYEGMAVWAEIQYAMLINEKAAAKRMEIARLKGQDEYGRGFRQYLKRYPFSEGSYISKPTPFMYKNNPL